MFDFFDKVLGFIETIWNLVIGIVNGLFASIKFLITGTDAVLYLVGFLPAIIGSCIAIFLFIYVLKFLLGR